MRKLVLNALALLVSCLVLFVATTVAQEKAPPPPPPKPPEQPKQAAAEEEKPPKPLILYRVDFAVHEVENGERVNTRSYTMLLEEGRSGRVRASSLVPVPVGAAQVEYQEVSMNIDCQLRERENYLSLDVMLEIKNFVVSEQGSGEKSRPIARTIRTQVATAVLPGKPTVVSSVDDTASKRRYELEVTATKVK